MFVQLRIHAAEALPRTAARAITDPSTSALPTHGPTRARWAEIRGPSHRADPNGRVRCAQRAHREIVAPDHFIGRLEPSIG